MITDKPFPVIPNRGIKPHPLSIPWSVAELAYSVYAARYGSLQSLERLAERGGFHAQEMDEYLPDWRERCDEITQLRAKLAAADTLIEELYQKLKGQTPCSSPNSPKSPPGSMTSNPEPPSTT